jgi:hypothetical protein
MRAAYYKGESVGKGWIVSAKLFSQDTDRGADFAERQGEHTKRDRAFR